MREIFREAAGGVNYAGGRKRIFIGLLCLCCLVVCLIFFAIIILPWWLHDSTSLRFFALGCGFFGIGVFCWLCLSLVYHIHTGRYLPGIAWVRHVMIRLLLPMMEIAGRFCGIKKSVVRRSFVKVNNEFVLANSNQVAPGNLLLLLPHCVQAAKCQRRLVFSLDNCADCGGCQIGWLRRLAKENGFHIAIATGGTVARKIVVDCRPQRIIAVACERDLTSGIQDAYPIPVLGILNRRPLGPCHDTIAPEKQLIIALRFFLGSSFSSRTFVQPVLENWKTCCAAEFVPPRS